MANEDTYIINVDTRTGQVSIDKLLKKVNAIYGGLNRLTSTRDIPTKGITRYTIEVTKAKKKVDELTKANRALASSYPRNVTGVSSKFVAARQKAQKIVSPTSANIPSSPVNIRKTGNLGVMPPVPMVPFSQYSNKKGTYTTPTGPQNILRSTPYSTTQYPHPIGPIKFNPNQYPYPIGPQKFNPNQYPYPIGPQKFNPNQYPYPIGPQKFNPNQYSSPIGPMRNPVPTTQYSRPIGPQPAFRQQAQTETAFQRLNKRLQPYNKAIFQTQMATLGVAFSFMSLQNTAMGLVTGLTDLSGNLKNAAMGQALGGVDVMGALGIDYKTFVDAWKSVTGILALVQTLLMGIIAKALTPEIVKAITDVIAALAAELGKPEVTKALQQLVLAFVDLIKAVIPVIVPLSNLITLLGETGLLKYIIGIILAASILLPLFSLIAGAFTVLSSLLVFATPIVTLLAGAIAFLTPVITLLSGFITALAGSILVVIAAVGIVVLLVVGTIVNAFNEFQKTGDVVKSIIFGFIDTFGAFVDAIGGMLNMLLGWTGKFNYVEGTATRELKNMMGGYSNTSVTNNYNINGDVFDPASLQTAINKTKGNQGASF